MKQAQEQRMHQKLDDNDEVVAPRIQIKETSSLNGTAKTTTYIPDTTTATTATARSTDSSNTPHKPLLIFKHYPKAGGGSIEMLLRELKSKVYQQQQFHKEYRYLCPMVLQNSTAVTLLVTGDKPKKGNKKKRTCQFYTDLNDTLVIVSEFSKVLSRDHDQGFVISSMREPCDQYVSLWSYGSNRVGYMYNAFHQKDPSWTLEAYGQDAPTFDSPRDINAFRNIWLRDDKVKGEMTKRFYHSFGRKPQYHKLSTDEANATAATAPMMPSVVDCWVYVDDFQATLYTCLREYENQGGHVNWDTPLVSALVQKLQQQQYSNRQLLTFQDKDDPIGNPQIRHHSKCSTYFNNETSNMVRYESDEIIYDLFGYQKCCGERTTYGKNIIPPPIGSPASLAQSSSSQSISSDTTDEVLNMSKGNDIQEQPQDVTSITSSSAILMVGFAVVLLMALARRRSSKNGLVSFFFHACQKKHACFAYSPIALQQEELEVDEEYTDDVLRTSSTRDDDKNVDDQ